MPELPEVETVRRGLELKVKDRVIRDVKIYHDGIIEYPSVKEFRNRIKNQRINDIDRYGKWLMFVLDDYYLLSHLRMEGKYNIRDVSDELNKHEHVVFLLDDDTELRYMDVRKFGKMHLIEKDEISVKGPLVGLGLEPWDKNLNVKYLKDKYSSKKLPIKSVLLDQSIVVGIGNIYADEILFLSGINPLTKAMNINKDKLRSIIDNTRIVLEKAIDEGGTTIRSYSSVDGIHGMFQQELNVHTKEGEKCPRCGNIIKKIKVGGRGTYYCDKCQKFD
ncbi:MAG: DNA-formamidopyrimidine glycosylase [Bacilli bacterium]|nr:DNA-formamidopyrimidine glycosylase [Bacilli bacterium]